jgi:hypothetical protein
MKGPREYDTGESIEFDCIFTVENTFGSIDEGGTELLLQEVDGYANADDIIVYGAGGEAGDLITTIAGILGDVVTVADPAGTSVVRAKVGKLITPVVACKVVLPDGTTESPLVSSFGPGQFRALFETTMAGTHWYHMRATGLAKGRRQRQFIVRENRVP